MRVPFFDPAREAREAFAELGAAFARVVASGRYVLGPEVERFEAACGAYIGAKHAVGVSSGTDALIVALAALGVGAGDEVLCPAYTFVATAEAIVRIGARPVFVDVTECCFTIDAAQAAYLRTARTRAVVPVHLFGVSADLSRIAAALPGVPILEDAAQAFGAPLDESRAGALGAAAAHSFFPTKNLGAFGDGGLLSTSRDDVAERARMIRSHGSADKQVHQCIGGNFRLDALQAALLMVKLPHVDARIARRREIAARYRQALAERERRGLTSLTPQRECRASTYNQFVVAAESRAARDGVRDQLTRAGIETAIYYPLPLPAQPCFAAFSARAHPALHHQFPQSYALSATTLALPIFAELAPAEVEHVASVLSSADVPADASRGRCGGMRPPAGRCG